MAGDPDLKVATSMAIQEMVDFLAVRGASKHEAHQLVSIAGNAAPRASASLGRTRVGAIMLPPKSPTGRSRSCAHQTSSDLFVKRCRAGDF
jgi:hypothetical protein